MNINSVEITNVKGIGNRLFQLDLQPNKPNILIAPNGFGKSSFALAFDRLKRDKIELGDREYFNKLTTNRPELRITPLWCKFSDSVTCTYNKSSL